MTKNANFVARPTRNYVIVEANTDSIVGTLVKFGIAHSFLSAQPNW